MIDPAVAHFRDSSDGTTPSLYYFIANLSILAYHKQYAKVCNEDHADGIYRFACDNYSNTRFKFCKEVTKFNNLLLVCH